MSVPVGQTTTTRTMYRTVNVASEPTTATVIQGGQLSPLPYNMNGSYDTVRYLVPVQQAAMQQQSVLVMPQMVQQMVPQMVPQMVSPVYLQSLPRYSVSSQEDSDTMYRQYSLSEVS